jgi:hypothetical protein
VEVVWDLPATGEEVEEEQEGMTCL